MTSLRILLALALLGLCVAATAIWFGWYDVAADEPHWSATYRVLEVTRKRSIATRAADIEVRGDVGRTGHPGERRPAGQRARR